MAEPLPPPPRTRTVREAIRHALEEQGPLELRELSALVGVSVRELPAHLTHLERSLRREGDRLVIEPARCRKCGYSFAGRRRHTRPGRCPRCRATYVEPARYALR